MTRDPHVPAREITPFGNFQLRRTHLVTPVVTCWALPGAASGDFQVPQSTTSIPDPTPGEIRAAALAVCAHSRDAAEARELLAVIGILDAVRATEGAS